MNNVKSSGKFYLVSKQPVFSKLKENEISLIADKSQIVEYAKEDIIFKKGEENLYFFIVIHGLVECYLPLLNGEEKSIETFRKGDYFGIVSVMSGEPHSLNARALTDVRLLRIDRVAFRAILEEIPALAIEITRSLSGRLRAASGESEIEIFQNEVLTVFSPGSEQFGTAYAHTLCDFIKKESGRKAIVLSLNKSSSGDSLNPPSHIPRSKEEVFQLLNKYYNDYHFIILDVAFEMNTLFDSTIHYSDSVHILTDKTDAINESRDAIVQRVVSVRKKIPSGFCRVEEFNALIIVDNTAERIRKIAREVCGIRIGLALGGGAALGLAQIGILKVIEANHIPIDMVVGTSIGSLVGGLWASGMPASEIEKISSEFDSFIKMANFFDVGIPVKGLFAGKRIKDYLRKFVKDMQVEETKIPFRSVACDITTRQEVVIGTGSLVDAIRASTAIPGVFAPELPDGGQVLVDGGVVNPLPVSVLSQEGINRIIAVNSMPSSHVVMKSDKGSLSLIDIMVNSLYSLQYKIGKYAALEADVYLNPILEKSSWYEFYRAPDFIKVGEDAAIEALPDIKKLAKK